MARKKAKKKRAKADIIPHAEQFDCFTQEELLQVSILFLDGLIAETLSPDSLALATYRALNMAKKRGLDEDRTKQIMLQLMKHSRSVQKRNPLHLALWGKDPGDDRLPLLEGKKK